MQQRAELHEVAGLVKGKPGDIAGRVKTLQKEVRTLKKDMEKLAAQAASGKGRNLMDSVEEVNGVKLLAASLPGANVKALREVMDDVRSKLTSGVP
jgi:alanyl-tRNA synthetase